MNEIKIVKVEPTGEPVRKGFSAGRPGFLLPVTFTLADGRTITSAVSRQRKKDLPDALAAKQRSAMAGCFLASFDEQGSYFGTVEKWIIGAAGMVPATDTPEPQAA